FSRDWSSDVCSSDLEDATDQEEGLVDVVTAFVADGETPETRQPRERAFDHPAVAAEALARFDSAPRDAALDPSPLQVRAAVPVVVGLVGMKLLGPPPR